MYAKQTFPLILFYRPEFISGYKSVNPLIANSYK